MTRINPEAVIVEVRNASRQRLGQIAPQDIKNLEIALMFNNVSSWKLELAATHPLANSIAAPGAGIVVSTDEGTIISGNTTSSEFKSSTEEPLGMVTVSGVDDNIFLFDQYAYGDPLHAADSQTKEKDTRTGSAEKILKDFVDYNIGPNSLSYRRVPTLIIETNLDRGPVLTKSTRFKKLGQVLYEVASVAELGFKIVQENDNLVFKVYEPTDLSNDIVWTVENNNINESVFQYNAPTVTHAIVGGAGKGVDRLIYVDTNTASLAAKAAWGRRIEVFVDSKESDTTAELKQAGDEALAEGVFTSNTEVTPTDATLGFMSDWNLGDFIKVQVNEDIQITAIIDGVALVLNEDGITIKASINKSTRKDPLSSAVAGLQTTAEGSGYKRTTVTFTTPSIAAGDYWLDSITMASGYRLLKAQCNHPARIRLYADTTGRDADQYRPESVYPLESSGLQFEAIFSDYLLNIVTNPTVDGWTLAGNSIIPITIENRDDVSRTFTITLTYIRTE